MAQIVHKIVQDKKNYDQFMHDWENWSELQNLGSFDGLNGVLSSFEKEKPLFDAANAARLQNLGGDKIGVQQNCQSGALMILDTFSGSFQVACPGGSRSILLI